MMFFNFRKILYSIRSLIVLKSPFGWRLDNSADIFVINKSKASKWIFVSYIAEVFYHQKEESYLNIHQNKREALAIVSVFENLGYNVYVQEYSSMRSLPNLQNVELVFGIEPLFEKACVKYKPLHKIYYATGAYWKHQNSQVKYSTDLFNRKFSASIPYRRMVGEHKSCEIADSIIQIGSKFTVLTYPDCIRHKISLVHQSSQNIDASYINFSSENLEFLFLGSTGMLLKGVQLLVESFSSSQFHPYKLNIVGPVEEDVICALKPIMTNNIVFHGYMNVASTEFKSIVGRCSFFIYPSASEGGCPGAAITGMKYGLIPILTRWSAFDEISNVGFMMRSLDSKGIEDGISWALSLSGDEVEKRKKYAKQYADSNFNLDKFTKEFTKCITDSVEISA